MFFCCVLSCYVLVFLDLSLELVEVALHECKRKRHSCCGFGWGGGRVLGFVLPPAACRAD